MRAASPFTPFHYIHTLTLPPTLSLAAVTDLTTVLRARRCATLHAASVLGHLGLTRLEALSVCFPKAAGAPSHSLGGLSGGVRFLEAASVACQLLVQHDFQTSNCLAVQHAFPCRVLLRTALHLLVHHLHAQRPHEPHPTPVSHVGCVVVGMPGHIEMVSVQARHAYHEKQHPRWPTPHGCRTHEAADNCVAHVHTSLGRIIIQNDLGLTGRAVHHRLLVLR